MIDLGNEFFIVKLSRREEFVRALSKGPWLISDNYLHVQRWRPNFNAESAKINSMPIWVRFPSPPLSTILKRGYKELVIELGELSR